jgi:hypothetical protein
MDWLLVCGEQRGAGNGTTDGARARTEPCSRQQDEGNISSRADKSKSQREQHRVSAFDAPDEARKDQHKMSSGGRRRSSVSDMLPIYYCARSLQQSVPKIPSAYVLPF